MPSLHVPLSTLRWRPCGRPRMTRGQDGSLLLSCVTLSFTTPRRFIPAHSTACQVMNEKFLPAIRAKPDELDKWSPADKVRGRLLPPVRSSPARLQPAVSIFRKSVSG